MPGKRRRTPSPLEGHRWLEQLESGVGITDISRGARKDIRVVKRAISAAEEARKAGEAQRDLVRDRLERHQQDLLDEIMRLNKLLMVGEARLLEPTDPIKLKVHQGLREHVKASTLGRMLTRYWALADGYNEAEGACQREMETRIVSLYGSPPRVPVDRDWPMVVMWVLRDVVAGRLVWRTECEKTPDGAGYHLDWMGKRLTAKPLDEAAFSQFAETHKQLTDVGQTWLPQMIEKHQEMRVLGAQTVDELEAILVKRLVPARCRYCPM